MHHLTCLQIQLHCEIEHSQIKFEDYAYLVQFF